MHPKAGSANMEIGYQLSWIAWIHPIHVKSSAPQKAAKLPKCDMLHPKSWKSVYGKKCVPSDHGHQIMYNMWLRISLLHKEEIWNPRPSTKPKPTTEPPPSTVVKVYWAQWLRSTQLSPNNWAPSVLSPSLNNWGEEGGGVKKFPPSSCVLVGVVLGPNFTVMR